jgi:hypothetical protein
VELAKNLISKNGASVDPTDDLLAKYGAQDRHIENLEKDMLLSPETRDGLMNVFKKRKKLLAKRIIELDSD